MISSTLPVRPRAAARLLLLASVLACSRASAREEGRPNLLLITLDTVRADHLSCYGYRRPTSPVLDRLAAEGQRFERFSTASSWTLPSHASLFTGQFPTTHGAHYAADASGSLLDAVPGEDFYGSFRADRLPERAVTLAEVLALHGYATGGVAAGPWLNPVFGLGQGFGTYDAEITSVRGRAGDEVTDRALDFLRAHEGERFFLFLNYFDAHEPYTPPDEVRWAFFDPGRRAEAESSPAVARELELALYDAEILWVDRQIGRLLDELRARGLYDDTWILVVSDHGQSLGEHGIPTHGLSLFEPEIRGVLIQKPPAGSGFEDDVAERCTHVDLMPTILERLGVEHDLDLGGQPLGSVRHPVVAELRASRGNVAWQGPRFDRDLRAVYDGRFKLVRSSVPGDRDAGLFDLELDPGELEDLSAAFPARVERMEGLFEAWERALPQPLPREPPGPVEEATREQLEALGYGDGERR